MFESVKNIIFDFGAVLLNIDYQLTINKFETLGLPKFQNQFAYGHQQVLFDQLETGKIDEEYFCESINKQFSLNLSNSQITEAWNAMLLDFPAQRVALLELLSKKYRLFLLSNTNAVHHQAFSNAMQAQHGFNIFSRYFEKAYFSHDLGLRKPEPEIYKLVLKENNLNPYETVFIDDVPENLIPAQALGIKTIHLPKGNEVCELFKDVA